MLWNFIVYSTILAIGVIISWCYYKEKLKNGCRLGEGRRAAGDATGCEGTEVFKPRLVSS